MFNQPVPQTSLPLLKIVRPKIPDFLLDERDIIKYEELVNIVFQIFSEGSNLTGKKRTCLWNQLFNNIQIFIQDENPENINFIRCVSVGVLLFQLEPKKTYIYLNFSILQNLFQKLQNIPSISTISKKVGKKSNLNIYNIPLLSQYREFIDKLAISFPKCNLGWDLYEFCIEKTNYEFVISPLLKSSEYKFFDEEIVDSIIDDDQVTFSKLLSQIFHNEKHVNLRFSLTKYKMPKILSENPTYADLCVFFQAQKCLTTMCLYVPEGLNSEEMKLFDNKSRTLLHFAAAGGCMNIVKNLLDTGFDINNIDTDGYSPSHYAAMFGHVDILKLFNEKGANIFNSNFPSFLNPFQVACHNGNLNVVNYFFSNASILQIMPCILDNSENHPLNLACESQNDRIVSFLLEKMYMISHQRTIFEKIISSSFIHAFKKGSIDCVKVLIKSKIMSSIQIDKKYSLLVDAVYYGHLDIVNFIIKTISINKYHYKKALKVAIEKKFPEIVDLLIINGACKDLEKSEIGDLFMSAFGDFQLIKYLDKMLDIPYEIKGKLFMEQAVKLKDEELITFLLQKKCEISPDVINKLYNQNSPFLSFLKKEKINIPVYKLSNKISHPEITSLDTNFKEILTENEILQFKAIQNHFQKIERFSIREYYSMIDALSRFSIEYETYRSIARCSLTGIIPSFYNITFKKKIGSIYAINESKISQIINKDPRTFSLSFLKQNAVLLNNKEVETLFSKRKKLLNEFNAYYQIMIHLGYDFKFYFIFNSEIEFETLDLIFYDPIKLQKNNLPNNIKFIQKWQTDNLLKKKDAETKKNIKNWMNLISQIKDLINIISDFQSLEKSSSSVNDSPTCIEDFDISKLTENELYEYALSILNELKITISQFALNNKSNENMDLEKIADIIYSDNVEKKEIAKKVIYDVINHKKHHSWENSKILEFSFLVKYCSSAAYLRIYNMLNKKLPSPSTVESHFRKQIIEREKLLTNSSDITKLLDQYWNDIKVRLKNYLDEYNTKFGTNINVENFKIPICLGCDAASLTKFTEKIAKEKKNDTNNKTSDKKNKNKVFRKLVGLESNLNEENITSLHEVSEENSQYFFTMLIQPFFWKLPCTVIHLTRSINGRFSDKEAKDILQLLNLINSHPHFEAKYFAADGEKGLDQYHELAFKQYEIYIEKLINQEISFEDFFQIVIEKVKFLPIIDMLHSEKSGRNRVINNDIKLGNDSDIISRNSLKDHLKIDNSALNDTSSIGRMKDDYPIKLFQLKNALSEFKNKNNSSGLYLFVYSIIIELFRNQYMKLDFRLFLSKLALLLLLSLYKSTYNLPSNTSLRKNKKSKNKFVWFNDRISIIKLINTTIAISTILSRPETSFGLGLDRISSYPDEEYFGNYRTHFNGFYTPQNAFRYAVRSSLAMDFQSDLNVEFQIPKRENFAGAHLNYENAKGDVFDKFSILDQICDDNQIYEIKNDVYKTGTGEKKKLKKSTLNFIQVLSQFFEIHQSYRTNKLSYTKGSSIMPRIKANQQKENQI